MAEMTLIEFGGTPKSGPSNDDYLSPLQYYLYQISLQLHAVAH